MFVHEAHHRKKILWSVFDIGNLDFDAMLPSALEFGVAIKPSSTQLVSNEESKTMDYVKVPFAQASTSEGRG